MVGKVVFWQKVPIFKKDKNGQRRHTKFELVSCETEVLGPSTAVCIVCNEAEQGHGKPRRRHGFTPNPNIGLNLQVTYAGNPGMDQTVELHNVQQGKEANCYTEVK